MCRPENPYDRFSLLKDTCTDQFILSDDPKDMKPVKGPPWTTTDTHTQ